MEFGEQEASSHAYTLDFSSLYSFAEPNAPTLYLLVVEALIGDLKVVYSSFLFINYHIMANVGNVVLTIVNSKANISSALELRTWITNAFGWFIPALVVDTFNAPLSPGPQKRFSFIVQL